MEDNASSEKKIKQYFTSDAWTALSEYEKRRYENVQRNYEFLKASGITPKMPEFMMTKYNHSNSKNQMKINSNMPKGVNVDIAFTATKESSTTKKEITAMISLRNVSPKEFAQTLILSAQNALKKLEEMIGDKEVLSSYSAVEEDFAPKQRYPKRSVERKCYTEEDISSEDESLHCDICDEDYKGACPVHGPMLLVCDTKVHKNDSQKAKNTLPYFLSIGISSLSRAGLGVWTEMPLTAGMVFGPYKGSLIKKTMEAKKSGYAWLVRKGLKVSHYVEGSDERCSNWMRYVNCADREERQNVVAFQYQGDIYYRTYKPVLPFTEILVWYGDGYASELGIDLQQKNEVEYLKEIDGFKCDVCDKLFSSSQALERHRRKHPSTRTDLRHQCPECSYSTDLKSIYSGTPSPTPERNHTPVPSATRDSPKRAVSACIWWCTRVRKSTCATPAARNSIESLIC
ncbi:probable histone-lysine N-methyltransferase PRDM7 [Trichonephila clavata]|uniref:Probable histone-lysine N-methyltransferase PRDM7 n=1 Tax=Trichonephila clavata TaxID=2740835 RepID=A0A8X6FSD8_TRICU|nr:probable histone-lysine N-methyltransferase PRDM7 [Trichonephila clavata]